MKILQINKFYYLRGGAERYFFELSRLLETHGHKVIHFSMADENNDYSLYNKFFAKKVTFDKISLKNTLKIFYNFDAARKLKKLIKEEKPDIAHIHNIYHHISPAVINILHKNKIPMVMTLHDYKLACPNYTLFDGVKKCRECEGGKYYRCFFKKCLKKSRIKSFLAMSEAYIHNTFLNSYGKVNLFIAPSRFAKDICVASGINKDKIKVLNNFLPEEYLRLPEKKSKTSNYFLYFGRLSYEKGLNILIKAAAKFPDDYFKIIGSGLELKNLEQKKKMLSLKNLEILGPRYGGELLDFIKNAKAVILPSVCPDNMPYSLLEAMALGTPVIASRIGGIPEIVEDNINGLLFNPGDSDDLAEKIRSLEKMDLDKIGMAAKMAARKLTAEKHYAEIMEIYGKLL